MLRKTSGKALNLIIRKRLRKAHAAVTGRKTAVHKVDLSMDLFGSPVSRRTVSLYRQGEKNAEL
ncbi:MAG: hypothetical protein FWB89_08920 [Treponema sp.]|nr:hypothetical protein [Treponema sp.]